MIDNIDRSFAWHQWWVILHLTQENFTEYFLEMLFFTEMIATNYVIFKK